MTLLYDGNCSTCRQLAYKVHVLSNKTLDLLSLSTSEGRALLDRFYPRGWAWDFYLVDGTRCRRGVRALYALSKSLGVRNLAFLLAEYGKLRTEAAKAQRAAAQAAAGKALEGPSDVGRRNALRAAAIAPFFLGLSRIGMPLRAESKQALEVGPDVGIAEVGASIPYTYPCTDCVRPTPTSRRTQIPERNVTISRTEDNSVLRSVRFRSGSDDAELGLVRSAAQVVDNDTGQVITQVIVHTMYVSHPRYEMSVILTEDIWGAVMMGQCKHDRPAAVVDFVIPDGNLSQAPDALRAYGEGVTALGSLHSSRGRGSFAPLYAEIGTAMQRMASEWASAGPALSTPLMPKLFSLAAMADTLAFVRPPASWRERKVKRTLVPEAYKALGPAGMTALASSAADDAPNLATAEADASAIRAMVEDEICALGACCGCYLSCISIGCGFGYCFGWPPICGISWCGPSCGCGYGYCCFTVLESCAC